MSKPSGFLCILNVHFKLPFIQIHTVTMLRRFKVQNIVLLIENSHHVWQKWNFFKTLDLNLCVRITSYNVVIKARRVITRGNWVRKRNVKMMTIFCLFVTEEMSSLWLIKTWHELIAESYHQLQSTKRISKSDEYSEC